MQGAAERNSEERKKEQLFTKKSKVDFEIKTF